MITGLTLCSGGGLAALGMAAAGVRLVGAVESDPAIAAVYAANLGPHILTAPVQEIDYRPWAGVDVLQVSPPCPSFSVAKTGGQETALDTAIAAAIVRALTTIRPRYFWLENVEGYTGSASYRAIRAALDRLDYWSHATVVNSADYGVPQTRRRLILRAVAGGWMQPFRPLPAPVPWVGWYAAIEDLLPTLPESQFADWQLKRLDAATAKGMPLGPNVFVGGANKSVAFLDFAIENRPAIPGIRNGDAPMMTVPAGSATNGAGRAFLVDSKNANQEWALGYRDAESPAYTVVTDHKQSHMPRAFLINGANAGRDLTILPGDAPSFTVSAQRDSKHPARAWLDYGRVVKMNARALARFQSVPDSYTLPSSNALACRIIGNGVACLVAQRVTESLLDSATLTRAA